MDTREQSVLTVTQRASPMKYIPEHRFQVVRESLVHPREVFRLAIHNNASSVIVAHNHPSGDPTPSREDIAVTNRIKEAGKILGIDLLDHIVVGSHSYSIESGG